MLPKCQTIFSHHQVRIVNNCTLISSHFDETKFGTKKGIGIVKKIMEQFVSRSITPLKVLKMITAICQKFEKLINEKLFGTSAEKEIAGLHLHYY